MTHVILRRKAIELRMLGKSYGEIRKEIGICKSTLSDWLKKYPLTLKQLQSLRQNQEHRIEKYRQTMSIKRETKLQKYYDEGKKLLLPLSKRELLIAGVFLYWGEGSKTRNSQLTVANTDPALVQFAVLWITEGLDIPKNKIQVLVHLYLDMDIEASLEYWSSILKIPRSQFAKPYIKKTNRSSIDYKGYGHGTCNLRVYNTEIKEKILMAIRAVGDYSAEQITKI